VNPWVLKIILALAPSIEKLIIVLIERWLERQPKEKKQPTDELMVLGGQFADRLDDFLREKKK